MNCIKIIALLLLLMHNSSFSMFEIPKSAKDNLKSACTLGDVERALFIMEQNLSMYKISEAGYKCNYPPQQSFDSWKKTKSRMTKMLDIYLDSPLDINAQTDDGRTLLHFFCRNGTVNHIKLLIEKQPNVNPNIKNENGESPLFFSLYNDECNNIADALARTGRLNIHTRNNKGESFTFKHGIAKDLPHCITNLFSKEKKFFLLKNYME